MGWLALLDPVLDIIKSWGGWIAGGIAVWFASRKAQEVGKLRAEQAAIERSQNIGKEMQNARTSTDTGRAATDDSLRRGTF